MKKLVKAGAMRRNEAEAAVQAIDRARDATVRRGACRPRSPSSSAGSPAVSTIVEGQLETLVSRVSPVGGGPGEEGRSQEGTGEEGAGQEGSCEEGAREEGAGEEGPGQAGASEEGSRQEGASEEGRRQLRRAQGRREARPA